MSSKGEQPGSTDRSETASKPRTMTHMGGSSLISLLGVTKSKARKTSLQRRRAELTCTEKDEDRVKVLLHPLKGL